MGTEFVVRADLLPIEQNPVWVERSGREAEVIKERSDQPDRPDDPLVGRAVGLPQAEKHSRQVAAVRLQVAIVFDIARGPDWRSERRVVEVVNADAILEPVVD